MKSRVLITFLFLLFTINSFSQTDTTAIPRKNKNEICLNISPGLVILLGGLPYNPTWGGLYKRTIKEKIALRIGLYSSTKRWYNEISTRYGWNEYVIHETDSTQTRRQLIPLESQTGFFHLGIEGKFTQKKAIYFGGGDISIGQVSSGVWDIENVYKKDTAATPGSATWIQQSSALADSGSFSEDLSAVGLYVFAGIKYPIGKHLFISANVGSYNLYCFGNRYNYDATLQIIKTEKVSEIKIYLNNIISDVSLVFRF